MVTAATSTAQACSSCSEVMSLAEFDVRADTGSARTFCKDCRRAYQRERYRGSRPPATRTPRRIGAAEAFVCTRCGLTKPADAFPPRRRGGNELQHWCRGCFAQVNARRYAENLEVERKRLYANQEARRRERRSLLNGYLASHPCVDCREADPVLLEFDHLRDKREDVANLVWHGAPWDVVLAEMAKCEVRCGNCHRRRTAERRRGSKGGVASSDTSSMPTAEDRQREPRQLQLVFGARTCCSCRETKPIGEFPRRSRDGSKVHSRCRPCAAVYKREWYQQRRNDVIARVRRNRDRTARHDRLKLRAYLAEHSCIDCGECDLDVFEFDHLRDKTTDVSTMVRTGWSWRRILDEIAKCEVVCTNCHKRRTHQRRKRESPPNEMRLDGSAATPEGIEPSPAVP